MTIEITQTNKNDSFNVAQTETDVDISFINYRDNLSYMIHTTRCNLSCSYCHNKRNLSSLDGTPVNQYLETIIDHKYGFDSDIDHIVITGGEPLIEGDNLLDVLDILKQENFKIKLDTNGTFPDELEKAIGMLDYIAMDIKWDISNCSKNIALTKALGLNNVEIFNFGNKIFESLDILIKSNKEFELRTTLCSPYFDNEDKFLSFVKLMNGYICYKYGDRLSKKINWYLNIPMLNDDIIYNPKIKHKVLIIEKPPEFTNIDLLNR